MISNAMIPNVKTSLDVYLDYIGKIPVLTLDEEYELTTAYFNKNDLKAAQKLILSHLKFVVHIAKGYINYGLPLVDLIQEGNIGLMVGLKKFQPDKGVRLVTFAVYYIKEHINLYIMDNWKLIRMVTTKAQRKLWYNLRRLKAKSTTWSLTQSEAKAIASELKVPVKDVVEMEQRMYLKGLSIDPCSMDDEVNAYNPSKYIEAEGADPADIVEAEELVRAYPSIIKQSMDTLDERARDIIQSRWIDADKPTLTALAAKYKVSAERIRQLEERAMLELKDLCTVRVD